MSKKQNMMVSQLNNESQYERELEFAKSLALDAGKIISSKFTHTEVSIKSNLTPVTEADLAVSKLVIEKVKENFPDHKVYDEELSHSDDQSEYIWVLDPIDGTIPFAHQVPTSIFSLALCRNKEPVVAVTYDPFLRKLFYTKKGGPSYQNNKEIYVSSENFLKGDFVYGLSYWNQKFNTNLWVSKLLEKNLRVSYIESIVYQLMMVATGRIKAMVTIAASPWDRAAGKMIVENALGKVTDENGNRLTVFGNPEYIVATNGIVHNQIIELLHQAIGKS